MVLQDFHFLHKIPLFPQKSFFGEISLFGPKISFPAPGPPKNLPERYVYKGFWAGRPKVPLLGEMSGFEAQNPKKK